MLVLALIDVHPKILTFIQDRNIRVECFDHNRSGNHSFIGLFHVTARQLMKGPGPENVFACVNPKKQVDNSGDSPLMIKSSL